MFTGLVEEIGTVWELTQEGVEGSGDVSHAADFLRLSIGAQKVLEGLSPGDSISVNGVCLTVTECNDEHFTADVMRETLDRSNLASLEVGDKVNLERAVQLGARLGGHLVQGHVDGTAQLVSRTPGTHWEVFRFTLPTQCSRYVVEKGSITVNGTSLTVNRVGETWFEVSLIPTTLAETNLSLLYTVSIVNIEVDVIAKYVEKLLTPEGFTGLSTD